MTQAPSVALPPRLPLVIVTSNRDRSVDKDARLVNCYLEVSSEERVFIYKRPGLGSFSVVALNEFGRGVVFWRDHVYSIFGEELYRDGVEVATGLDATNGVYKFDFTLGAEPKLILGNGKKTYAYDDTNGLSADLHTIDNDFPIETVKGYAYLNGSLYVGIEEAELWNSVINSVDQPGDWNPIDFIAAQIESDDGVAVNKQLVYVIFFKEWSTEVFFDAGNPTGSPLAPVQGSKASYGCASADSVQRIDDVLFWLATNQTASKQLVMMRQLAVTVISTPSIDKLLEGVDPSSVFSWQIKIDGHSFYVITFKLSNLTLAYDIDENTFFQWTDTDGNYYPIVSCTYDNAGNRILQHEFNGRLYVGGTQFYSDLNDPIVVDIFTPVFDAATRRRKQLNYMEVIGDQVEGSILECRHSDDDYETWSKPRIFDLGAKKPFLMNLGTFVKRAYNFRHKQNLPLRIEAVEVQYDLGTL